MIRGLLTKILGDPNEKTLKQLWPIVEEINDLEPAFRALSDQELRDKTIEFKARLLAGDTLDDILPEAFAAVREAARRTIGLRHYDVQLIGGIVLHQGKVAEMKTGEGKTLVATLALYLNALEGKGAHLVTPNDYLAKRDAQWMGPIYHALGLSVGVIQSQTDAATYQPSFIFDPEYKATDDRYQFLRPVHRRDAYLADITYGTNNEFGFDYLRDNMVIDLSQMVQRELHYAIVDEVDNILIDEARTPLIISGPAEESSEYYKQFAQEVRKLRPEVDYTVDEKMRVVTLTEEGIEKMERWLGVDNLYSPENYHLTPYLENALKAQVLFKRDKDYIVKDGEIIIVDEFTGRLMYGRRYSEGLHQAIEAKEGVPIQRESLTLATITFQNYFRMYHKLAGMTGTAYTEAEEFAKIYNLDVVVIPTHRPMIREDLPDLVYKSEKAKFKAVVQEIEELHKLGRPVLVGTTSVEKSEYLSELLRRRGIPHQVLNAKLHEKEAGIIAQAGQPSAVTIATNMAGRGVDILLGGNPEGLARERLRRQGIDLTTVPRDVWEQALAEAKAECEAARQKVLELGGLHILGTERHEARRIDNQLRGRAGRQGDPGTSRFYVSLEDELMVRFGGQNVASIMERLGVDEDVPIEHNLISKSIENAQIKVEGYNFDLRKHLLEYDDVINQQRNVIYEQRKKILSKDTLKEDILGMVRDELREIVNTYTAADTRDEWDLSGLINAARAILPLPATFTSRHLQGLRPEEIEQRLCDLAEQLYEEKEHRVGESDMRQLERLVMLRAIDNLWIRHLTALDELRTGIGLRAFGQRDPLVEFKREGHHMFQQLTKSIEHEITHAIFHAELVRETAAPRPIRHMQTNRGDGQAPRRPIRSEPATHIGRNDPCYCGSGRKYKRCHMRQDLGQGGSQPAMAAAPKGGGGGKPKPQGKAKKRK